MGLGAAAQRAAATIGAGAALEQQLAALSSGVVPWTSRRRRFAANVKALAERWPEAERLVGAWDNAVGRYELHVTAAGGVHVWDRHCGNAWGGWLGGFSDHRGLEALWQFDPARNPLPAPVAFDGIGHGWLVQRVLSTTERSYLQYSCAVYVVEPDLAALAMVLHMHDLQAWLRHPRLRVYAGEGAAERFAEDIGSHDGWTVPQLYLRDRLTEPGCGGFQELGQKLRDERAGRLEGTRKRVAGLYAGKDAAHWARRFAEARSGGPPLRVLGLTSRYTTVLQYSMEELQAAVGAARGEARAVMEMVREPDDQSLENGLSAKMEEFRPDLIVQISRMRYENPELPREVPFLCWDQDSLPCMRSQQATASLNALTYVAGYGAIHGYHQLGWPLENCICVHQAGATHRYSDVPLAEETLAPYRCDFSFVSNASGTPEELRDGLRGRWEKTPFAGWFDLASRRIIETSAEGRAWFAEDLPEFLRRAAVMAGALHSAGIPGDLLHDVRTLADRCFRHSTLHWVSRWCGEHGRTLKLYGQGWERHPVFRVHAAGPARPGEELRAIYQATTINLQIIESGFLHGRAWMGWRRGAFSSRVTAPTTGTTWRRWERFTSYLAGCGGIRRRRRRSWRQRTTRRSGGSGPWPSATLPIMACRR